MLSDWYARKMSSQNNNSKGKIVINSFPYDKDPHPTIIQISKDTGKIECITKIDSRSFKNIKSNISNGVFETFLPAGYPQSVGEGYLKFSIYSNLSALTITAMSFLSAQSLFVAIGG